MNTFYPEIKKNFGFGMMRLPMNGDAVDIPQTCDMVDAFINAGFNYFDTAHGYIGGKSELAVKECLTSRYPRDSYILTDKLSPNFFNTEAEIRPYFQSMLEACGVEYFDFFLLHSLTAGNYSHYTGNRAFEIASELKAEGKVRHVGISFHDKADVLDKILSEQPVIEVVQLQFNYLDYEDAGVQSRLCYEVCVKHGKPVIVMEPVRGGSLVNLPEAGLEEIAKLGEYSPAGYAIRYAASFDNIFMVLSGMSNMEQMTDNVKSMKNFTPFTEAEFDTVYRVADIIRAIPTIPCTSCKYCTDGDRCPMSIRIHSIFGAENKARRFNTEDARGQYNWVTSKGGKPTDCIECGACEEICPQQLPIRQLLKEIGERFEG
jgi:predicted aldo/keto reductase-like oxidoreductase